MGSCLHVVYLSRMAYKLFRSFSMSTIVKSQEQMYYLLLLVIFSNDKTLYNPLSKYRNLVKVSYKKLRNWISDKYLIHVSCNNAFFSKLIKKAVIGNFDCQKNTSAGAPFLIGMTWSCTLFIKKRLWHSCFSENIEKHLLQNDCEGFKQADEKFGSTY